MKIPVYDDLNPKRLLGYLTKRPIPTIHNGRFVLPVVRSAALSLDFYRTYPTIDFSKIEFSVYYKIADDGWSMEAVLHTKAPLDDLLTLNIFLLPGEEEHSAEMRRAFA